MPNLKTLHTQTKAFTMIELVFVIVVLGILAALALPRIDRDLRQEAADNILSAVRYTQHLALNDDKTDPFDENWQKELWQIQFVGSTSNPSTAYYKIGSDTHHSGALAKRESAVDPANGKYMHNTGGFAAAQANDESPNIFIGHRYGITRISSKGCTQSIAFDNLGRPHDHVGSGASNQYEKYMTSSECNLTFTFSDNSISPFSIIIKKETGYAYIDGQDDS
jgi:prepilin-type N-terminal cleavage/methylation domain-containing protein